MPTAKPPAAARGRDTRRSSRVYVARRGRSGAARATSSRTRCRNCSTPPCSRTASRRPASTASTTWPGWRHHHPQHPGLPRPRAAAPAAAGRPDRAVQRHPPDPAAADHLDARPRLQHRPRARDAQRLGAGQGPRRHARAGVGDRGQLGHREAGTDDASPTPRRLVDDDAGFDRLVGLGVVRRRRTAKRISRAAQADRGVQRDPAVRHRHRQAHRHSRADRPADRPDQRHPGAGRRRARRSTRSIRAPRCRRTPK